MFHKVLSNEAHVSCADFKRQPQTWRHSNRDQQLQIIRCRTNYRKYFFPRTAVEWNSLLVDVVEAPFYNASAWEQWEPPKHSSSYLPDPHPLLFFSFSSHANRKFHLDLIKHTLTLRQVLPLNTTGIRRNSQSKKKIYTSSIKVGMIRWVLSYNPWWWLSFKTMVENIIMIKYHPGSLLCWKWVSFHFDVQAG